MSNPAIHVRILETATDEQIKSVAMVCVRAFGKTDKALEAMIGGNYELSLPFWSSLVRAVLLEGVCYVVTEQENSNDFCSVAMWYGPGHNLLDSEAQKQQGFYGFYEQLPQETKEWWNKDYIPKFDEALVKCFGPRKSDPFWYANCIATDPPSQRKGYASALVRIMFARGEKEKVPVALSTPTEENARWYNSLGFKTVGKVVIKAPTVDFDAFIFIYGDKYRKLPAS